ncbi:MAG TPA: type II toxin-antitoxin system HicA family toxin [bacterium]|nr:type II toxin-antitoxin system HicA family toxin [bacterium]HPO09977.1 type II toxin-antitoxin system HicA family toxin [bacterium]HQO37117.1 type II toxin-antitoxin system HicA family toxin [bacterium]HQP97600.1 type II toxin-antitoxin system HicA family toxin [bacterium]
MRLPLLSPRQICSILEKEGFALIRQKGSHRIYHHPDGRVAVIPVHTGKMIGRGLLKAILEEIEMDRAEFLEKYVK